MAGRQICRNRFFWFDAFASREPVPTPLSKCGQAFARKRYGSGKNKRKGLQLALEPLNGQGIAGYVPQTGVVGAIS